MIKTCKICGTQFESKTAQRICSDECKKRSAYLIQKRYLYNKKNNIKVERKKKEESNRLSVGDVITMKCAVKNDDKSEDRYGFIYEGKTLMKVSSDKYFKDNTNLYYKLKSSEIPKKLDITVLTRAYIDYYIEENVIEFFEEVRVGK